jgi:hypothetical protein
MNSVKNASNMNLPRNLEIEPEGKNGQPKKKSPLQNFLSGIVDDLPLGFSYYQAVWMILDDGTGKQCRVYEEVERAISKG